MRYLIGGLIVLAPLCLAVFLFVQWTVPSGVRTVSYRPGHISAYVQRPLPDERVTGVQNDGRGTYIGLTDEPVYFSVQPPFGSFERATVEVEFEPQETPILELGGLRDVAAQAFDFKPLSNLALEALSWSRYDLEEGISLFSANNTTAESFFLSPPARSSVATYRAVYPAPYREANYRPCSERGRQVCHAWNVALRGPHEALTYIKEEQFSLTVKYVDLNRTYGADEGFVKVFNEAGEAMKTLEFKDDNNISTDQQQSTVKTLTVTGDGWPEGVYRVALAGTSDIAWRYVATNQRYFVFKNILYIGDDVGFAAQPRATKFFTNAKRVVLETAHAEGLQTVTLGNEKMEVAETHEKYVLDVHQAGALEGSSPVGDIKITGEGKYALSAEAFFDPDPVQITAFTDFSTLAAEYIYATVPPVTERAGWRVAAADFALADLAMEAGAYKFALSAPGLETFGTVPQIHRITVRFAGEPPTLREMLASLWHRPQAYRERSL